MRARLPLEEQANVSEVGGDWKTSSSGFSLPDKINLLIPLIRYANVITRKLDLDKTRNYIIIPLSLFSHSSWRSRAKKERYTKKNTKIDRGDRGN